MPTRRVLILEEARRKRRHVLTSRTRYRNSKGRPILRSVQVAYIVKVGPKTLYGRKAARPVSLLAVAPYQIRP
jgi:hypothetical protein